MSDGEWHRAQAIECNNSTWEMIEAERTSTNDEEMLRRAYASAYHWARAAGVRGPANDARAAWLLAKVQLLAGQPSCRFVTPISACRSAGRTVWPTSILRMRTRLGLGR